MLTVQQGDGITNSNLSMNLGSNLKNQLYILCLIYIFLSLALRCRAFLMQK